MRSQHGTGFSCGNTLVADTPAPEPALGIQLSLSHSLKKSKPLPSLHLKWHAFSSRS